MEKLKAKLKQIRKQDILLWGLIVICLLWMLSSTPPDERWERGQRILLLSLLICYFNRSRKKS